MDEKLRADKGALLSNYSRSRRPSRHSSAKALRQYLFIVVSIFVTIIYVIPKASNLFLANRPADIADLKATEVAHAPLATATPPSSPGLVPLEAHIMSKCPDAKDCLVDLVVPAMEQISDKVDFKLSYIGTVGPDGTVDCKHGPTECLGNMLGLCAAQLYPDDPKRYLGFMTCMIRSYKDIPSRELVENCSLEHGISFNNLNACISEEGLGMDLLEASVERSQAAGVVKSCTVRVKDEIWCIRDGGQWTDCKQGSTPKDLVDAISRLSSSA